MRISIPKQIYYYLILSLCFCIFSFVGKAQNVINEYSNFECSQSKRITIPFPKNSNTPTVSIKQTVFYEHRDQFSYWYKLAVNEDQLIECKINPINSSDSYVLYVYKYDKSDFCNKVFSGKIKPLKPSAFINNTNNKEAFELSEIKFKVKQNEGYYFCVLNTSPSNCGHTMRMIVGNDTLEVKAIHIPCSEEDSDPKPLANKNQKKQEQSLIPLKEKVFETITLSVKEENNDTKKIDAGIKIKEELTGNEIKVEPKGNNSYKLQIEKGKSYNVTCTATGYKNFGHSIIISEYVKPDSNLFDIVLKPLKTGDVFVMNNIYFYPNTYALKKGTDKELSYLLNYLNNNSDIKIELQGHTNGNNRIVKNRAYKNMGEEWNYKGSAKKLSLYRAEAIKKYLVNKGINDQRINAKGFGGDNMIIANPQTLDDIQKNVRVEVMIL
jgi:outer membrane protein OmpA-like peptidoglycan-associated protein